MTQQPICLFKDIDEKQVVKAWHASKSKTEVLQRLNVTNFGSKEKRLKAIIEKYKLPSFGLKKVEDLSSTEIKAAFCDPSVTTLKSLCVKLGIAKKMQNFTLKERIKLEKLEVPDHLHKAIFGVSNTPTTYPRVFFIKRNQQIPTVCPECGFNAKVAKQIQLHHEAPSLSNVPEEAPAAPKEVPTTNIAKSKSLSSQVILFQKTENQFVLIVIV